MASWGATDANESKPSFLTTAEKRTAYATTKGWVVPAGGNDNASADAEVLIAIGGLSSATKLNIADISSVNWGMSMFSKAAGGTLKCVVNFNEQVDVVGTPQLTLTNDTPARNQVLDFASGTGTNRLTFTKVIAADNAATDVADILSLGANALSLNGGTVKEKGTSTDASILNIAGIGTAMGTLAVAT
jgi:hypothetical protein